VRLDSSYTEALSARGFAWLYTKNYDKASADFEDALRLDPQFPLAFFGRANVWSRRKEYVKAIADFDEAIRLDPRPHLAHANRARIWAASVDPKYRDAKKALESATKACELTRWNDAYSLSMLAVAHAAGGDFAAALE
jgi:tetratricopeptide (TPR) repeat protein